MNAWSGSSVLVTGAEGFIGSTLVRQLLDAGAAVRAFVHYKPYAATGNLDGVDVDIVAGDIRDTGVVADAVEGCDVVFHLGALIGVPYSHQAPESYVTTNVTGTHNVAAACRRHDARLVHTSTSEVYGTARVIPMTEAHPLQPQSPYSASKIGADMMALSYWHTYELPVSVVRPFKTYGPRQSASALIPMILEQLHAGAREIKLGATEPTRDFTYVDDTARGFLEVGASDKALGEVVNLGSGTEIALGDLAAMLIDITGSDAKIVTDQTWPLPPRGEADRMMADTSKARALTGWVPQVGLREGLTLTSEWVRANCGRSVPVKV